MHRTIRGDRLENRISTLESRLVTWNNELTIYPINNEEQKYSREDYLRRKLKFF